MSMMSYMCWHTNRELQDFVIGKVGKVEVIYTIHAAHNPYSMEWSFEVNLRLCPNTRALETSKLHCRRLYWRNKSQTLKYYSSLIPRPSYSFSMLHTEKREGLGDKIAMHVILHLKKPKGRNAVHI